MKKQFILCSFFLLLFLSASIGKAKTSYFVGLIQGHKEGTECVSSTDGICYITKYDRVPFNSAIPTPGVGEIYVLVSDHLIKGNTLQIIFKDKLRMKLKS